VNPHKTKLILKFTNKWNASKYCELSTAQSIANSVKNRYASYVRFVPLVQPLPYASSFSVINKLPSGEGYINTFNPLEAFQ